jgi:hypothetical protein
MPGATGLCKNGESIMRKEAKPDSLRQFEEAQDALRENIDESIRLIEKSEQLLAKARPEKSNS